MSAKLDSYKKQVDDSTTVDQLNRVFVTAREDTAFLQAEWEDFEKYYRAKYAALTGTGSKLPSWLLPAALVGLGLLVLTRFRGRIARAVRRRNPGTAFHLSEFKKLDQLSSKFPRDPALRYGKDLERSNYLKSERLGIPNPRRRNPGPDLDYVVGRTVKIGKYYGGGTGKVIEIAPGYSNEYLIVKTKKRNKIFHYTDVVLPRRRNPGQSYHLARADEAYNTMKHKIAIGAPKHQIGHLEGRTFAHIESANLSKELGMRNPKTRKRRR